MGGDFFVSFREKKSKAPVHPKMNRGFWLVSIHLTLWPSARARSLEQWLRDTFCKSRSHPVGGIRKHGKAAVLSRHQVFGCVVGFAIAVGFVPQRFPSLSSRATYATQVLKGLSSVG